jgi:hypothetical protein
MRYVLVCAECDAHFTDIEEAYNHQSAVPTPGDNMHGGFDIYSDVELNVADR